MSHVRQGEEVPLRCHSEEEVVVVAGSSGLSLVQPLLLQEHLHS